MIEAPLSAADAHLSCKAVLVRVISLGLEGVSGSHGGVRSIDGSLAVPATPSNHDVTQTQYSVPGLKSWILFGKKRKDFKEYQKLLLN